MRIPRRRRTAALITCLAVFSVLAVGAVVQAQEQSEEMQIVVAAEQLVQQQKPDEALAELQKIFEKNDEFAPAYFVAGLAYEAKNQAQEAFDNFVKAAEFQPGWGIAHRKASFWAANTGDLESSWEHAIKAHQAGTDMSDAFEGLQTMAPAPDDLDAQLAAYRVFIGPFDTTVFEESGDTALQGGADSSATARTDRGSRIVQEAAGDIFSYQQEARRQFAGSRAFGLVQRQEAAQFIFVTEVDSLSDNISRRRMRAVVKLVDARSGEEAYRRRVDFSNIVSQGDLNRDFTQLMNIMEEWAAEQRR
jgi:tetratricopeptide (TPR) repeat protein